MSDIKEILKQSEQFEELVKEAQWGAAARLIGRGLLGGARAVGRGAVAVGRGIGTGARAAGTAIRGGAQRIINLPQSIRAAKAAEIAAVRAEAVAARTALRGSLYESILKSPHGKQAFKLNPQGNYVPNLNSKYWTTPHARGMLDSTGALKNDALQKLTSELATVKKLQTAGLKMKAIREAALASSTARIANIAAWNAFKAKLPAQAAQAAKGAASLIGTVGLYYMFSGSDSPPPDASVDVQKLLSSTIPPQSSSQVNTASETIGQISSLTSALNQAKSGKSSSTVEAVDSYISSLSSISEDLKKLSSLSSISKSSMENYKAVASSLNSKISNSDRANKASGLADALNQANKTDLAQQIESTETSLFQYSSAIQQAMTLG